MAAQLRKAAARGARDARGPGGAALGASIAARWWPADGRVAHPPTKRTVGFGELTQGPEARADDRGTTSRPTPAERWTVAGQSVPKVGGRDVVTGRHKYTSDLRRPGMLLRQGAAARRSVGATLASVEHGRGERARRRDRRPRRRLRRRLRADDGRGAAARWRRSSRQWKPTPQPRGAGPVRAPAKNPTDARAGAASRGRGYVVGRGRRGRRAAAASASSRRPTPSPTSRTCRSSRAAAVAEWQDGELTVWTGTQRPFGVRSELAEAFRVPGGQGPRDRARHRLGLRRQAHGRGARSRRRGWRRRGTAGEGGLDARRGVPLGLLPARGRHRRAERRGCGPDGTIAVGVPQLQLRRLRRSARPTTCANQKHRVPPDATRRCARARTAGWPRPRTISRARSHMDELAARA